MVLRVRPGSRDAGYPRAELVAAAWPDANQLAAFTSAFGIKGYRDYQELLDNENIDIVLIAAPVALIPELAIRSARAGKHIVLGKPMAMTVDEADRMIEAVDRAGVLCFPYQGIMRLRGADLKHRIDAGQIGDLSSFIKRAAGRLPKTGTNQDARAGSRIRRRCRAARSSTRGSTGSTSSGG